MHSVVKRIYNAIYGTYLSTQALGQRPLGIHVSAATIKVTQIAMAPFAVNSTNEIGGLGVRVV